MRRLTTILLLSFFLAPGGCSDDTSGTGAVSEEQTNLPDTGVRPDAERQAAPDSGPPTTPDPDGGAGSDVGADAGSGADSGPDAEPDTGPEPVACDGDAACEAGQICEAGFCEAGADCDDGSERSCTIASLDCAPGQVSALRDGCFVCVDGRTCDPPDKRSCGGRTGASCEEDEYCAIAVEDICGIADATGFCKPKPASCTAENSPVCGCDGTTYTNACEAAKAGKSVMHNNACFGPPGDSCGGLAGVDCPQGEYCELEDCSVADSAGVCQSRPDVCPDVYDPVCGCNGQTYGNACMAASAGVTVESEGACP